VKADPSKDTRYKGGEHADATIGEVCQLAKELAVLDRIQILTGIFPDQTGSGIPRVWYRYAT
jgi:hypothetical protein